MAIGLEQLHRVTSSSDTQPLVILLSWLKQWGSETLCLQALVTQETLHCLKTASSLEKICTEAPPMIPIYCIYDTNVVYYVTLMDFNELHYLMKRISCSVVLFLFFVYLPKDDRCKLATDSL